VDYDRESNTIQIENYGQEPVRLTEALDPELKPIQAPAPV
jgi:hypothetical protein